MQDKRLKILAEFSTWEEADEWIEINSHQYEQSLNVMRIEDDDFVVYHNVKKL